MITSDGFQQQPGYQSVPRYQGSNNGMPLEAFLYATFDRDLDLNKVKFFKESKN